MALVTKSWKLKVYVLPCADFTSSGAFDTLFTRYTSRESFLSIVIGSFRTPIDNELTLYERETRLSMDYFIASVVDYTHTGSHDLTPESILQNTTTRLEKPQSMSILGCLPGSRVRHPSPLSWYIGILICTRSRQGCRDITSLKCRVYKCMHVQTFNFC